MSTQTTEPLTSPDTIWDRLMDDLRKRPKFYVVVLLITGVLAAVGALVWQATSESALEAENDIGRSLKNALENPEPTEGLASLNDLAGQMEGTELEPWYLYEVALGCKQAAADAKTQDAKERYYKQAIKTLNDLESRHADSVWVQLPWRVPPPNSEPGPSLAKRLLAHCEAQQAWLQQHPLQLEETFDADLLVALELEEPPLIEGDEPILHRLRLHCFSDVAPYAVDNFVKLLRSGFYTDTYFYGVEKTFGSDDIVGVHLGSAMSKVAPKDDTLWTTPEDHVGYSLPMEPNHLEKKRGRLAMERDFVSGGVSSTRFVVFTADANPRDPRAAFAEVVETDLKVLDKMVAAAAKAEGLRANSRALFPLQQPWKIKSVTVDGQPAHPPARPLKSELTMPEGPKTEEPETPDPKKSEETSDGDK